MKLTPIGSNQTELEYPSGLTVLFSYQTPVAVFVPGSGGFVTSTKYSPTTSRHVNKAIERWGCSRTEIDQAIIDERAAGR